MYEKRKECAKWAAETAMEIEKTRASYAHLLVMVARHSSPEYTSRLREDLEARLGVPI